MFSVALIFQTNAQNSNSTAPLDEGAFGAFWHQQAHFQFLSKANFGKLVGFTVVLLVLPRFNFLNVLCEGGNVGYHFVVRGNVWYLFHRGTGLFSVFCSLPCRSCLRLTYSLEYGFAPPPSYCKYDYSRIVVRTRSVCVYMRASFYPSLPLFLSPSVSSCASFPLRLCVCVQHGSWPHVERAEPHYRARAQLAH